MRLFTLPFTARFEISTHTVQLELAFLLCDLTLGTLRLRRVHTCTREKWKVGWQHRFIFTGVRFYRGAPFCAWSDIKRWIAHRCLFISSLVDSRWHSRAQTATTRSQLANLSTKDAIPPRGKWDRCDWSIKKINDGMEESFRPSELGKRLSFVLATIFLVLTLRRNVWTIFSFFKSTQCSLSLSLFLFSWFFRRGEKTQSINYHNRIIVCLTRNTICLEW